MQDANQNIDQIFKEYYQNHSIEPQAELWQNIDSKLNNKQISKSSKWMKWSVGISSVIILAVITIFQFKTEKQKPIIENKKEILVEKKDSVIVSPIPKTDVEVSKIVVKNEKINTSKAETTKSVQKTEIETPKPAETTKIDSIKTKEVSKPIERMIIYRTLEDELIENNSIDVDSSPKNKKNKKSE